MKPKTFTAASTTTRLPDWARSLARYTPAYRAYAQALDDEACTRVVAEAFGRRPDAMVRLANRMAIVTVYSHHQAHAQVQELIRMTADDRRRAKAIALWWSGPR